MNTRRQRIRRGLILGFFLLLPITLNYYSPALMTQATAEGVASASLIVWTLVFVTSLVVGRAFCGYGCPFNGLQTAWEKVSDRPTRTVRHVRWIKYALWAGWAGAVLAFGVAAGGWSRFEPLYMTEHVVSVDSPANLVVYYALVGVTLAPTLMGKRGFCHYFCPFGVWGIVGTRLGRLLRLPRLHLAVSPDACTECGACDRVCPMSLPVRAMVAGGDARHTECILCGSCVDSCPGRALRYAFGKE